MKYFVKYEVKSGDKFIVNPGLSDFNSDVELNAGQLKVIVKEWLSTPDKPIISEVLKSGNKELLDNDILHFSGNTSLIYKLKLSGNTGTHTFSGDTRTNNKRN